MTAPRATDSPFSLPGGAPAFATLTSHQDECDGPALELVGDLAVGAGEGTQQAGQVGDVGVLASRVIAQGALVQVEPDGVVDLVAGSGPQGGEVGPLFTPESDTGLPPRAESCGLPNSPCSGRM